MHLYYAFKARAFSSTTVLVSWWNKPFFILWPRLLGVICGCNVDPLIRTTHIIHDILRETEASILMRHNGDCKKIKLTKK